MEICILSLSAENDNAYCPCDIINVSVEIGSETATRLMVEHQVKKQGKKRGEKVCGDLRLVFDSQVHKIRSGTILFTTNSSAWLPGVTQCINCGWRHNAGGNYCSNVDCQTVFHARQPLLPSVLTHSGHGCPNHH